ncbi:MAG: hypothetical protein QOH05_3958, partial [Acetobacteraceae bacterium]|nr:hypothetical protein [Acetobacteraceae bacterium]
GSAGGATNASATWDPDALTGAGTDQDAGGPAPVRGDPSQPPNDPTGTTGPHVPAIHRANAARRPTGAKQTTLTRSRSSRPRQSNLF